MAGVTLARTEIGWLQDSPCCCEGLDTRAGIDALQQYMILLAVGAGVLRVLLMHDHQPAVS